jgi:hypothetical protein
MAGQETIVIISDSDSSENEMKYKCIINIAKNISCDDMGSWKWSGSFNSWCLVSCEGFVKLLGKDVPESGLSSDTYHIWKRYYCLQASPDVKKMIVLLKGCFVIYFTASASTYTLPTPRYINCSGLSWIPTASTTK